MLSHLAVMKGITNAGERRESVEALLHQTNLRDSRMKARYVDGLATRQPRNPDIYREIGKQTASLGYARRDWKKPLEAVTTK